MQQGPLGDVTAIPVELWGIILSELSPKEMVYFQLASKITHQQAIEDAFWSNYLPKFLPSAILKQHEEILHFKNVIDNYVDVFSQYPAIIHHLNRINNSATCFEEFLERETLLNDINATLIKSRISLLETLGDRLYQGTIPELNISNLSLTRFPRKLFKDKNLQDYWNNLMVLECEGNPLQWLELGDLPKLHKLNCRYNKLKSLILRNCPTLLNVDCRGNQLISLSINQCAQLKNLNCMRNQLAYLELPCPRLYFLNCNYNKLTSLSISQCSNLIFLYCINNDLKDLDVSQSSRMKNLRFDRNKVESLNVEGCLLLQKVGIKSIIPLELCEPSVKRAKHHSAVHAENNGGKPLIPSYQAISEEEESPYITYSKNDNEEEEKQRKRRRS